MLIQLLIFSVQLFAFLSFVVSRAFRDSLLLRLSTRALFVIRQIPSFQVSRAAVDVKESCVNFTARFSSGDFDRTLVSC
jgi:hypothetical protein